MIKDGAIKVGGIRRLAGLECVYPDTLQLHTKGLLVVGSGNQAKLWGVGCLEYIRQDNLVPPSRAANCRSELFWLGIGIFRLYFHSTLAQAKASLRSIWHRK